MFVRRVLRYERCLVVELEEQVRDIVFYGEAACSINMAFGVVLLEVNASKLGTFPVLRDLVVFLEYFTEMVSMAFTNVLDTEIINDEATLYGPPQVLP